MDLACEPFQITQELLALATGCISKTRQVAKPQTLHGSSSEVSHSQCFGWLQSSLTALGCYRHSSAGAQSILSPLQPHPTTPHSFNKTSAPRLLPLQSPSARTSAELPVLLLGKGEQCVNVMAAVSRAWKCFSFQCWCY